MRSNLHILYSAGGLLAIDKPPGLPVHSAPGPGSSVLKELIAQTGLTELTPVHRLDKDATGVLLFAETKALAAEVQREWDRAEKSYYALCDGVPAEASGVIDAPILENQTGKPERLRNAVRYFEKTNPGIVVPPLPAPKTSAVHPAGRPSQTEYKVISDGKSWSMIEARPKQGRMHQIRVHLAYLGHPLVVDPLYGKRIALTMRDVGVDSDAALLDRMPLHARQLNFQFRGERIEIAADVPNNILAVLDGHIKRG